MNIYQAFFTLKEGVRDVEFAQGLQDYMSYLEEKGYLKKWRLMRRKLGLGPSELGEFHLMMEFETLDALDQAFGEVSTRSGEVESKHHQVNKKIASIQFSLYRDFPDSQRVSGEELF